MDCEPSTSMEADKNITAKVDGWTKSLKYVPGFSYEKLEKHLVVDDHLMASLLRLLSIRRKGISCLKLVIQGSLE